MDVFSHGLWAGAAAKAVNLKKKKPLKVWLAMVWGIFPDVFAFAISFAYLNYFRITGGGTPFAIRPGEMEPPVGQQSPILQLTHYLYDASHSLLVFFVVFSLVAWYFRRPVWEMSGWLLHILMDIPTHSLTFFPTPFLWPLSHFVVNGIRWGTRTFMLTNYSLLVATYALLWWLGRKKKKGGRLTS
jgi:hypothetical protein